MPIIATKTSTPREPIEAGNFIARCYQMIHIGTVQEIINGEKKILNKVRIGWELPTELKVFKEERGEQPLVISEEYTLSLHEKSSLRKVLASWRGKDFSEEEAKGFDIEKLIGAPCMLNIIHKKSVSSGNVYEKISSISSIPKGMVCPAAINKPMILSYDNFNQALYDSLPDFLKDKIKTSVEYTAMKNPGQQHLQQIDVNEGIDDLPF